MKRLIAPALLALALIPSSASAWAPAPGAIHPGAETFTNGAQCTANFVYSDGSNTYIGQAAHCSSTGSSTDTNGCTSPTLPVGTPVDVTGANHPGTMVYNSWATMQAQGETDAETCAYNDLALVRLDPADVGGVNPSVPGFGGPVGVASLGGIGSTRGPQRQPPPRRGGAEKHPQQSGRRPR